MQNDRQKPERFLSIHLPGGSVGHGPVDMGWYPHQQNGPTDWQPVMSNHRTIGRYGSDKMNRLTTKWWTGSNPLSLSFDHLFDSYIIHIKYTLCVLRQQWWLVQHWLKVQTIVLMLGQRPLLSAQDWFLVWWILLSNVEIWCFLWCTPEHAVEPAVQLPGICDAIMLLWCCYDDN